MYAYKIKVNMTVDINWNNELLLEQLKKTISLQVWLILKYFISFGRTASVFGNQSAEHKLNDYVWASLK